MKDLLQTKLAAIGYLAYVGLSTDSAHGFFPWLSLLFSTYCIYLWTFRQEVRKTACV